MHSFEVHSDETACRKSGRLGLDQVFTSMVNFRAVNSADTSSLSRVRNVIFL